jgi:hypothetical protein
MKHFALLSAFAAAFLTGCSTAPEDAPAPEQPPADSAPVAASSASFDVGKCGRCHAAVFEGHLCGKTVPCRMCGREAGAQHRHSLVWTCLPCHRTYVASHVCNDSRACPTCRTDEQRRMPARACTGCGGILSAVESRPTTAYCAECNLEAGPGHVHGKTRFCGECEREAGANHVHNATKLCADCGSEVAPDHLHGVTAYCASCGLDQGLDHKHGRTVWCRKCRAEKVDPHTVHTN